MLTVGADTYERVKLGATVGFTLASLVAWIVGNLIGENPLHQHIEAHVKLMAYLYVSQELSWLVIVPLLLSVFAVALVLRHHKTCKNGH